MRSSVSPAIQPVAWEAVWSLADAVGVGNRVELADERRDADRRMGDEAATRISDAGDHGLLAGRGTPRAATSGGSGGAEDPASTPPLRSTGQSVTVCRDRRLAGPTTTPSPQRV